MDGGSAAVLVSCGVHGSEGSGGSQHDGDEGGVFALSHGENLQVKIKKERKNVRCVSAVHPLCRKRHAEPDRQLCIFLTGCCFARKGVAVCKTGMLGADVAQPASLFALASGGDESAVWCLACVRVMRCGRSRGLARMRVAGRIGGRIPAGTACEASSVAANLGVCGHMCPACTVGHCEQRRVAGRPLGCCIQTFASLCFCQQSAVLWRDARLVR